MKKTRIIATLLAALMTVSALPIATMASSAPATTVENATLTTGETDVKATSAPTTTTNNKYLNVAGRASLTTSNGSTNGVTFTIAEAVADNPETPEDESNLDNVYYVKFKIRTSVDIYGGKYAGIIGYTKSSGAWDVTPKEYSPNTQLRLNSGVKNGLNSDKAYWKIVSYKKESDSTNLPKNPSGTTSYISATAEWGVIELKCQPSVAGTLSLNLQALYDSRSQNPFDIDEFEVYMREGNVDDGAIIETPAVGSKAIAHTVENFEGDTPVVAYVATKNTYSDVTPFVEVVEYANYDVITPDAVTTNATYVKTLNEALTPGKYTITGDVRYGCFYDELVSDYTNLAGKTEQEIAEMGITGVQHDGSGLRYISATAVDVYVKIGEGDWVLAKADVVAKTEWTQVVGNFTVAEDATLTGVKYVFKNYNDLPVANTIRVKNLGVAQFLGGFDTVATDDATNFLGGASLAYSGAAVEDVEIANPDGFLYFPVRNKDNGEPNNYFTVNTGVQAAEGETYYFGFDIKSASFAFRAGAFKNQEATDFGYKQNGYVIPNSENKTGYTVWNQSTGNLLYPLYDVDGDEWTHFEAQATPVEDAVGTDVAFSLVCWHGFLSGDFAIDNFKVWTLDGNGNPDYIYENDFNNLGDFDRVTNYIDKNALVEHELELTHTKVTPIAAVQKATLKYNLAIPEENAVDANYIYTATLRTEEVVDGGVNVTVTFTYDDQTSQQKTYNVTRDWTDIAHARAVEGKKLVSVSISYTGATALQIRDAALNIVVDSGYRIPNIGIIMMLLLKNQDAEEAPVEETPAE